MRRPVRGRRPRLRLAAEEYNKLRLEILRRDSWRCQDCGGPRNLEVHHIHPRSQLGHDHEENLITLCSDCHRNRHCLRAVHSRTTAPNAPGLRKKRNTKPATTVSAVRECTNFCTALSTFRLQATTRSQDCRASKPLTPPLLHNRVARGVTSSACTACGSYLGKGRPSWPGRIPAPG
jgi:HNH endonuclease